VIGGIDVSSTDKVAEIEQVEKLYLVDGDVPSNHISQLFPNIKYIESILSQGRATNAG
jgi:hypothetical protein